MTPEEFNKIIDTATDKIHQETVINIIQGKIANLEKEVGYLRGGTAWNDVAQKMLTFDLRLKEIERMVADKCGKERKDSWVPNIGDYAWGVNGGPGGSLWQICYGPVRIDNSTIPFLIGYGIDGLWCSHAFQTKEEALDKLKEMIGE